MSSITYPNSDQKTRIATWLEASRWVYNLTVEVLQSGIPAAWRHIAGLVMAELKVLKPEWESVPYQVKRTAVRDACRAMRNVRTFNRQLAADRARGERLDEPFAQLRFRSRKTPRQSCYVRMMRSLSTASITPFWDRCGWLRPSRRGKRNAGW